MYGYDFSKISLDKDDLNNDRRDLDFENMKKAHSDYLKMLQSGNHGRNGFIGDSDVGDFMMVTDLRCWWQNQYVGDFFHYVSDFLE